MVYVCAYTNLFSLSVFTKGNPENSKLRLGGKNLVKI